MVADFFNRGVKLIQAFFTSSSNKSLHSENIANILPRINKLIFEKFKVCMDDPITLLTMFIK